MRGYDRFPPTLYVPQVRPCCPPRRKWLLRIGTSIRCIQCGSRYVLRWHGAADGGVKSWDRERP